MGHIMASITDITIVGPEDGVLRTVESGAERLICGPPVCASSQLTAFHRTIAAGRQFTAGADKNYHLLYVIQADRAGSIRFNGDTHEAGPGAGLLLTPGERATLQATGADLNMLHLVVTKPPAAVEGELPGGPGYFFNRGTLRALTDASGGRVRRFCAESSVRLLDGRRLTPTNAIQAGEMHYHAGGSSPYHMHRGTSANPQGADHCYITFQGRGRVQVEDGFRDIKPGTLVYFPPGVPHRLSAQDGALDYFEIQAWRSFKTTILSEEPLGLKWYYERERPGAALVEWNQS